MKYFLFYLLLAGTACNSSEKQSETTTTAPGKIQADGTPVKDTLVELVDIRVDDSFPKPPPPPPPKPTIYSNKRFKDVTVERTGDHQFLITGKAQVFEANISWVVEDGHNELKKGFVTTDAGAPAWGNFKFNIDVTKKRANSTLTLILFESSAKDGSRQHELPIVLY